IVRHIGGCPSLVLRSGFDMAKPLFMRGLLSTVLVAVSLTAGQSLARAEGFDFPALVGGIDDAMQAVTLDSDSHQVARQVIEQAAVGRVGFRPVSTLPHPHAGFVPSAAAVRLARERLADALVAAQPATSRAMILRELNSGVLQAEFARRLRVARM